MGEGGERSSSSSDASSGYCGSQDLLLARAEVHPEPREASLPRRPTSSLSSFAPTNSQSTSSPPRPELPLHCSESPTGGPLQSHSTGPSMCKRIPLQVLQQGHQYNDASLPDPPSFVDNYIERISAAQQVLRAFPPTAQSQVLINWSKGCFHILNNSSGGDCADQSPHTYTAALERKVSEFSPPCVLLTINNSLCLIYSFLD